MTTYFHKPFDRKLYNENNAIGNKIALECLTQNGFCTLEDGEVERYSDRDCLVQKNNTPVAIEVERKLVWRNKSDWEGYPTIRVPYRKRASKADFYIMINKDSTCLVICRMEDVKQSKTTIIPILLSNAEETFFLVPITSSAVICFLIFSHSSGSVRFTILFFTIESYGGLF